MRMLESYDVHESAVEDDGPFSEYVVSERDRYQLSAAVFVLLTQGDQVCTLRRKGTGWMDGAFSVPAGGLEAGETLRAAAIREAREEVGVRIAPDNLEYVHTLHSKTNGSAWSGHFFRAMVWEGTPALCEPDKHDDLRWQPIDALPPATIPYVLQAIEAVATATAYSEYGWD